MKEEILHKAWEKKKLFLNRKIKNLDQDYPLAIQQKRKEYSEVKQVLKQNKICFQTVPCQATGILCRRYVAVPGGGGGDF